MLDMTLGYEIRNCEFSNATEAGLFITADYVNVSRCLFYNNSQGIRYWRGGGSTYSRVDNCSFSRNNVGIWSSSSQNNVFLDNIFEYSPTAAYETQCHNSAWRRNLIRHCAIAFHVMNPGYYNDPDSQQLVFRANILHNLSGKGFLYESPDGEIDARSNWWGHSSGPYHGKDNPDGKGAEVSDEVNFDPWLRKPEGVELPSVVTSHPGQGDTDVPPGTTIELEFSWEMNRDSVEGAIRLAPDFVYSLSWDENTLELLPEEELETSTSYTITILQEATDQDGWEMEEDFALKYTTEAEKIPPEVVSHWPERDAVGVHVEAAITVFFSEPMNTTVVEDAVEADFEFEMVWDEEAPEITLLIIPDEQLLFETSYSYGFGQEACDLVGNPLSGWEDVSFETEAFYLEVQNPVQRASVSGLITITGNASPMAEQVEFNYLGGGWTGADDFQRGHGKDGRNSGDWVVYLNTNELENAEHELIFRCVCGDQLSKIQILSLNIANNEALEISSFTTGKKEYRPGDTVSISATVSDPDGVEDIAKMSLELRGSGGELRLTEDLPTQTSLNYGFTLPGYLEPGSYQLILLVEDEMGKTDEEAISITVLEPEEDDDEFTIAGQNGYLVLVGWLVVTVVILVVVREVLPRLKERAEEQPRSSKRTKTGRRLCPECRSPTRFIAKHKRRWCDNCEDYVISVAIGRKRKASSPSSRRSLCPACSAQGEYSEEYADSYCWECEDYFEDLR